MLPSLRPVCLWKRELKFFSVFRDSVLIPSSLRVLELTLLSWLVLMSLKPFKSFKRLFVEGSCVTGGSMKTSCVEPRSLGKPIFVEKPSSAEKLCQVESPALWKGSALWRNPALWER